MVVLWILPIYFKVLLRFEALNGTPSSRNFTEGENILKCKHLILCEATEMTKKEIHIYALCLQTSALDSPPHTIEGILEIEENAEVKLTKISCTCKAGDGSQCKHIAATLLYCNRNDVSQLNILSSTDKKCLWSQRKGPALAQYEPKPLLETKCFTQPEVVISDLTVEMQKFCFDTLVKAKPDSALAKHHKGCKQGSMERLEIVNNVEEVDEEILSMIEVVSDIFQRENELMMWLCSVNISPLFKCCKDVYNSKLVCNEPLQLCRNTCIRSADNNARQQWKLARQFRITGSRCYSIFTYSKDNWLKKCSSYFWPSLYCNKNMQHGIAFEQKARDCYMKEKNLKVIQTGLIVNKDNPWLDYSPDGIILGDNGKPIKLLEIKCLGQGQTKTILEAIEGCKYIINEMVLLNN